MAWECIMSVHITLDDMLHFGHLLQSTPMAIHVPCHLCKENPLTLHGQCLLTEVTRNTNGHIV